MTDFPSLIASKEKEIREINEARIRRYEDTIREKDAELLELRSRFVKLKEDFQYNLTLIGATKPRRALL
jgi:hypothetical protein